VNAGYGWNTNSNNNGVFVPGVGFVDNGGNNDGGFVGGGQLGYNWQIGSFVIGAEADIQWADIGNNNNNLFVPGVGFVAGGNNNGMDWFGTVRARAGVAFDRFLVYATGGFAYSDNNRNSVFVPGVGFVDNGGSNTGWTVGGGVEWALPVNWFGSSAVTFGVEGLYVNLGHNNNDNVLLNNVAFDNNRRDNEFGVVRAKLNFKF
jgi:outer membrane immunogenic protein